ncbi:MAG: helix-turn-helix transcriptional regulator [Thiohalomonadaceae bacterium]
MELPRSLWPVLEGGQARPFAVQAHADRRLPLLLRELEQHDYEGVTARLYQEAKGLELVAHLARVWAERKAPARWRWNRRDLERLHEARRRLSTPTGTPGSLAELARSLGLSPSKLKRGFREVFGTTMSETLREARLQAARRLLLETGLPLKTIALQVGFCDAASLGNAFRKRFGVPPGALRRS